MRFLKNTKKDFDNTSKRFYNANMNKKSPYSPQKLEQYRKSGWRPQVVLCCLYAKKILMVYKEKHKLWQIPQGGIELNEEASQAFFRELQEELGETFASQCTKNPEYIGTTQVSFPPEKNSKNLQTSTHTSVPLKGKKYFIFAIHAKKRQIDITQTEFNKAQWMTFGHAFFITKSIYQPGKKRMTRKALKLLKELNFIR